MHRRIWHCNEPPKDRQRRRSQRSPGTVLLGVACLSERYAASRNAMMHWFRSTALLITWGDRKSDSTGFCGWWHEGRKIMELVHLIPPDCVESNPAQQGNSYPLG